MLNIVSFVNFTLFKSTPPVSGWMSVWGDGDPSVTNLEMQPVLLRPQAPGRGHNGLQLHTRVTGHSGGLALK